MPTAVNNPPDLSQVEVSIIGPGYGESIIIHLGDNKWVIIDSCIDPETNDILPLKYLSNIGVDPKTSVVQVVATHWHDDHMRGLSSVLEACYSASFVCAGALRTEEFFTLVSAYSMGIQKDKSGVYEFHRILKLIEGQTSITSPLEWAIENKCVLQDSISVNGENIPVNLYTLSPSNAALTYSITSLSNLLPKEKDPKIRIPDLTPNILSVVILINVGEISILLGSDLEETGDQTLGWSAILSNKKVGSTHLSSLFKVPHHGSVSAYHPDVWQNLLEPNCWAALTPFLLGRNKLPTKEDIKRLLGQTNLLYITGKPQAKKSKKRNPTVDKQIKDVVRYMRPVYSSRGHIRFRSDILVDKSDWDVELFEGAHRLK